jgi:hypothetical protein
MSVGGSSSNPDGVQSRALKLGAALLVALERRGGDAAADVLDLQHLNAVGNTVAERSVKQTILRNQARAPSRFDAGGTTQFLLANRHRLHRG